MKRLSIIVLAVAVLGGASGCCTLMPGKDSCEAAKYATGWSHNVMRGAEKPRCADDLLAVADTLLPDPALRPLHGVIQWWPQPFMCSLGQMVWGCSPDLAQPYVVASVVGQAGIHASDTALAEEVAHWVWARYRPSVNPIEEWRVDPETGKSYFWRDPDFKAWYQLVAAETRGLCK